MPTLDICASGVWPVRERAWGKCPWHGALFRVCPGAWEWCRRHPQRPLSAIPTPRLYCLAGATPPPTPSKSSHGSDAARTLEPLNGPWLESDLVLIRPRARCCASFRKDRAYSRRAFPNDHELAWLPDKLRLCARLPRGGGGGGGGGGAGHRRALFCTPTLWHPVNANPNPCIPEPVGLFATGVASLQ